MPHAVKDSFGEGATPDAMFITQYQQLVHYAIAGYGCPAAFGDLPKLDSDMIAQKALPQCIL